MKRIDINIDRCNKILLMGNVHCKFSEITKFINDYNPNIVIQCGDIGIWRGEKFPNSNIPIYFCEGNHEDYDLLYSFSSIEISKNIFHLPRTSTLSVGDITFLFMGGADSIDKNFRTPGFNWFPQETISQRDIYELIDKKIDIVISHSAPMEFNMDVFSIPGTDSSRKALSVILEKYNPDRWFFGHFHKSILGNYKNTKWRCLNQVPDPGCVSYMEIL